MADFVITWATRLASELSAPRRALDVAMGGGRHAHALADAGYRLFGIDRDYASLRDARNALAARGLTLRAWCADLTTSGLPSDAFELVVVTRYLQRDLFPSIRRAVTKGGVVIYETFTVKQLELGWGPTSRDHLLEPGELGRLFAGFEILSHEEAVRPEAVARLVARRPAEA
jgi:SAM-dependent methyltransferase